MSKENSKQNKDVYNFYKHCQQAEEAILLAEFIQFSYIGCIPID